MMTSSDPKILTTVVGSYPIPDWLAALPSEQALIDATGVVFKTQELAGIDVVADGELYRFDVNHPETNGMIDYFVRPLDGVRTRMGRSDAEEYSRVTSMGFRNKPAGVVESAIGPGALDLVHDFQRARSLTTRRMKFTLTGPHMLSKTLLNKFYKDTGELAVAIAQVFAEQVPHISADIIQIDEANITGSPEDAEWAVPAMNLVLEAIQSERGLHLCFGNYGGQTIQKGTWERLVSVINQLRVDHVILELARRTQSEMEALKGIDSKIAIGLGVVDIKSTIVESPDEIAHRIERAVRILGEGRVRYIHPDCGFWMLKRSIADRKMRSLVKGRDQYLGVT